MSFDMPKTGTWEQRGGWVLRQLVKDLKVTPEQAAGIVGNLGFESAGFTQLHEIGQPEGKGGYGWAQWTASRRVAFFRWCAEESLNWWDDEANYGFLLHELRGSQAKSLTQLKKTTELEAAVFTFGYHFEKPGGTTTTHLPGLEGRIAYAQRALREAPVEVPVADHLDQAVLVFNAAASLLQSMLQEKGFYEGEMDGDFGPASRAALLQYLATKR